jgi:hypothetical protein
MVVSGNMEKNAFDSCVNGDVGTEVVHRGTERCKPLYFRFYYLKEEYELRTRNEQSRYQLAI